MKGLISFGLVILFFTSCKKDKFTSEPQIHFKSFSSNVAYSVIGQQSPLLKLNLRDAEGDLGYADKATYVYVKNITTQPLKLDSFLLPDLSALTRKNMDVDVEVEINSVLTNSGQPVRPYTDTLFFEVYVKDLAGNKSNVLNTPEPLYLVTP